MKRATISTNRIVALAALVMLAATTIPCGERIRR